MQKIFLIRHGENRANLTHEFSHRIVDYPLNAKGRLQAAQTAEKFSELSCEISCVCSSPLLRAAETAGIIASRLGKERFSIESFREVNVGILEKKPPTDRNWDLYKMVLDRWQNGDPSLRFENGENLTELVARFRKGLNEVCAKCELAAIIVGHGGLFRAALPVICPSLDRSRMVEPNANCSVSEIEYDPRSGIGNLLSWGDFRHLSGKAAELVPGVPGGRIG